MYLCIKQCNFSFIFYVIVVHIDFEKKKVANHRGSISDQWLAMRMITLILSENQSWSIRPFFFKDIKRKKKRKKEKEKTTSIKGTSVLPVRRGVLYESYHVCESVETQVRFRSYNKFEI